MIREQSKALKKFLFSADLCIVAVSFFAGYFIRARFESLLPIWSISFYIGLLPVLLIIWGTLLYYFGMYTNFVIKKISEIIIIVVKTTILGFILFGSYVFILHLQEQVTRLMMGITFATAAILILSEKIFLIYIFRHVRQMGISFKSTLFAWRSVLV